MSRRWAGTAREVAALDLFAGLPRRTLRALATVVEWRQLDDGEIAISAGEVSRELLLVADGTIAVRSGPRHLFSAGPGSVVGEAALAGPSPASFDAVAAGRATVAALDSDEVAAVLKDHPEVAVRLLPRLAQRGIELTEAAARTPTQT